MDKQITIQPITQTLEKNYMPYAMSVIVSRAIPEIDGLKPSHRKLLYTMYKMGLLTGSRTKSANVVGQTMKLNPHGDMAIYETMVRLTGGNEALLHPLVDSKGNFGKQYSRDMAFAASRYTEVKLEPIAAELFTDIDKNTVDFTDNYDSTLKEPTLLPTSFPNILVNPNQGIAVGMASNICSFNLEEICNFTIAYLKDKNCDIFDYITAPDFSTGAQIIYNKEELEKIYATGKGTFKLRSCYNYDKKNNCIEVTQIPYSTTTEAIIDKIIELIKGNKIREISDVRDETDINGLKIAIDLKRGTNPDALMNRLFNMTTLQDTFSCNFNILINSEPMVLGVREIIDQWCKFRIECIKRSLIFDINKKSQRLHLVQGLKKILMDIDKAIAIIRNTEKEEMVVSNLMIGFSIDRIQAEYIAEIKLRNLNKEYILNRVNEIDQLINDIDYMQKLSESEKGISKLIIKDLERIIKKYAKPRKTQIINADNIETYVESEHIEDYPLHLYLTKDNYFKKVSMASLRAGNSQHKLKEGDVVVCDIETTNKTDILFFSDKQAVYKVKTYDMNDVKLSVMGDYLPNLLELDGDERIVYMIATSDYKGMVLFAFKNGKVAKIPLEAYATKTNRKKLINAYSANSDLCSVEYITKDTFVVLYDNSDRALTVNTADISLKTTKSSQGIQVMNLRKRSALDKLCLADNCKLQDFMQYKSRNIPASGYTLKGNDAHVKQLSLLDE